MEGGCINFFCDAVLGYHIQKLFARLLTLAHREYAGDLLVASYGKEVNYRLALG